MMILIHESDNLKMQESKTNYWVTGSSPMEFNIYKKEFKYIKVDKLHYD